jgi:hypothetical protein
MPWIGDEIEAHLRLGRVPLFNRSEDGSDANLADRQRSIFPPVETRGHSGQPSPTLEDERTPFAANHQISEALEILEKHILLRGVMIDENQKCLKEVFDLHNIEIQVLTAEGVTVRMENESTRNSEESLREKLPEIRAWLESGAD